MNEGLVYIKKHPQYPLFLLNYTPRTQYRQKWCKELMHARGLVVGEDGKILARPLPKFFNHYEINDLEKLQDEEYEVYEKFDGSLVIMFHYENHPIFCTRGSFISEQAAKAQEIFRAKYNHISVNKECTYCFEVIYPENKIVVNYEDVEDLFLISITHTSTGKEINIHATGFKTVNKVDKTSIHAFLSGFEEANMEGYVVKYTKGLSNQLRVKYKFNTYVEKHTMLDTIKNTLVFLILHCIFIVTIGQRSKHWTKGMRFYHDLTSSYWRLMTLETVPPSCGPSYRCIRCPRITLHQSL